MIYLNEKNLKEIGVDWDETINVIEDAVKALGDKDFAQPIKPYLRYGDPKNRIIAMPAYVGGDVNKAGIKWIASFPDNIYHGIPRANSAVILNKAETGEVESVINTAKLSMIRTAAVTGLMIKYFEKNRDLKDLSVGIIGFGPIGQHHLSMCKEILGDKVSKYYLYDMRPIINAEELSKDINAEIIVCDNWEEVYDNSDIFMACTVTDAPYVDKKPKKGALILNISLRDFKLEAYPYFKDTIIVDDWEEVCREKTTIEDWNIEYGLEEDEVKTIVDVVVNNCIKDYNVDQNIMFNPMGMAVFDVAMGAYYYKKAIETNKCTVLK